MNIKYILCLLVAIIPIITVKSQISEGGIPPSFAYQAVLRSASANYDVQVDLDIDALLKEDQQDELNGVLPRYAVVIPIDVCIDRTGYWQTLPNSEKIWQQTITAKGATGLILSYKDFYIPKGGKLFIYNDDKSQILGSYTYKTNPNGGSFSTEVVYGDKLTLEYITSTETDDKPRIEIEDIGYVYSRKPDSFLRAGTKELPINGSWPCMINVNCDEGRNWANQKRGVVCYLIKLTSARWSHCTGSLINNTARNGKPYVLTASHNLMYAYNSLNNIIFYFNYEFPSCYNEDVIPLTTKSLVGCEILVDVPLKGGSDAALLKIKGVETIPVEWKPFYNGWDISDNGSSSGAVIHHPYGDVKKIILYNRQTETSTVVDREGAIDAHWKVFYNGQSVTQASSSGAPIFNTKGLIIGTLTGGNTDCDERFLPEYYGKMSYNWDRYIPEAGKPAQKMKPYLDPLNKNVEALTGHDPNNPTGVVLDKVKPNLVVFSDQLQNELNINSSSIIRKVEIYNMAGRKIYAESNIYSSTISLPIVDWSMGIYQLVIETDSGKLTEKFLKK